MEEKGISISLKKTGLASERQREADEQDSSKAIAPSIALKKKCNEKCLIFREIAYLGSDAM